jgi:hypothetical protein
MVHFREGLARQRNELQLSITHVQFIAAIRHVRDLAETSRDAAKAAQLGLEIRNRARTLRLRAERLGGQYLAGLPLKGGDKRSKWKTPPLTLADLGLDRDSSKRWQLAAKLPEAKFECYLIDANREKREISAASVYRLAKLWKRVENSQTAVRLALRPSRIHPTYNLYRLVEELYDHLRLIYHNLLDSAPWLLDGSSRDDQQATWRRVRTTDWRKSLGSTRQLLLHLRHASAIGEPMPPEPISRIRLCVG